MIRASSGIFYEPTATNLWYNTFINSGNPLAYQASIAASSPLAPGISERDLAHAGSRAASPDITAITPNFRNAYTINTSVQITRR